MNIFDYAINEVKENKEGLLSLPTRQKLWLQFGNPEKIDSNRAVITNGLCKRIELAKKCIEKVAYLWKGDLVADFPLETVLKPIDEFLNGEITDEELYELQNLYFSECEQIGFNSGYDNISAIGFAALYIYNVVIYDEPLLLPFYRNLNDGDLDAFTWDTAYLINIVYRYSDNRIEEIKLSKKYWLWYINCARDLFEQ